LPAGGKYPQGKGLRILSLFSGAGGLDEGLRRALPDAKHVGFAEPDEAARAVLKDHWPGVPVHWDARELADRAETGKDIGRPNLVVAGFPCQDVSQAGKGTGMAGSRTSLYRHALRIIRATKPEIVLFENVPGLRTNGLALVLADLHAAGYDATWDHVPAAAVGAPSQRDRIFLVAHRPGVELHFGGAAPERHGVHWRQTWKEAPVLSADEEAGAEALRRQGGLPVTWKGTGSKEILRLAGNAVAPPVGHYLGEILAGATEGKEQAAAAKPWPAELPRAGVLRGGGVEERKPAHPLGALRNTAQVGDVVLIQDPAPYNPPGEDAYDGASAVDEAYLGQVVTIQGRGSEDQVDVETPNGDVVPLPWTWLARLPTPTATEGKGGIPASLPGFPGQEFAARKRGGQLRHMVTGSVNHDFAAWAQGFPQGWFDAVQAEQPREKEGEQLPLIKAGYPVGSVRLFRAAPDTNCDDSGTTSFAAREGDAVAYLDNPGFGGSKLYTVVISPVLRETLDLIEGEAPSWLAGAIRSHGAAGKVWALTASEVVRAALAEHGIRWVRFTDDFPVGCETWALVGWEDGSTSDVEDEMEEIKTGGEAVSSGQRHSSWPPTGPGWQAIPKGKHGGFRRRAADGDWEYTYPSEPSTLQKGKAYPPGTIRQWRGGPAQKQADGKWKRLEPTAKVTAKGHPKIFRYPTETVYDVTPAGPGLVRLTREGTQYGPTMPEASVKHFVNDIAGRVELPPSGNPDIDAVTSGQAKLLGKGDDGIAFQVGNKVVKVSTTVPYHPENPGHRSPQEAIEMLRRQSETGNKLADLGVPGIQRSEYIVHGDKGFQIKSWVEIPEKLSQDQLDQLQESILAMHRAGYSLNDEPQGGLGPDGRMVQFDVGKAAPTKESSSRWDNSEEDDLSRLRYLYQRNDVPFVRLDRTDGLRLVDKAQEMLDRDKPPLRMIGMILQDAAEKIVKEAPRMGSHWAGKAQAELESAQSLLELVSIDVPPRDPLAKGKKAQIGEVHQWQDGPARKVAEGKWEELPAEGPRTPQKRAAPAHLPGEAERRWARLEAIRKALPAIRQQVDLNLREKGLSKQRISAGVVFLLDRYGMRVGKESHAAATGHFGACSLRRKHATPEGDGIRLSFPGKAGVAWSLLVDDPAEVALIRRCLAQKGTKEDPLFRFNDAGALRQISDDQINAYLKQIGGETVIAHSLRTYRANQLLVEELDKAGNPPAAKRPGVVRRAIAAVAKQLFHGPAACQKSYLHPAILAAFLGGQQMSLDLAKGAVGPDGYTPEERRFHAVLDAIAAHWRGKLAKGKKVPIGTIHTWADEAHAPACSLAAAAVAGVLGLPVVEEGSGPDEVRNAFRFALEKGRGFPIGTVRNWRTGPAKKVAEDKWAQLSLPGPQQAREVSAMPAPVVAGVTWENLPEKLQEGLRQLFPEHPPEDDPEGWGQRVQAAKDAIWAVLKQYEHESAGEVVQRWFGLAAAADTFGNGLKLWQPVAIKLQELRDGRGGGVSVTGARGDAVIRLLGDAFPEWTRTLAPVRLHLQPLGKTVAERDYSWEQLVKGSRILEGVPEKQKQLIMESEGVCKRMPDNGSTIVYQSAKWRALEGVTGAKYRRVLFHEYGHAIDNALGQAPGHLWPEMVALVGKDQWAAREFISSYGADNGSHEDFAEAVAWQRSGLLFAAPTKASTIERFLSSPEAARDLMWGALQRRAEKAAASLQQFIPPKPAAAAKPTMPAYLIHPDPAVTAARQADWEKVAAWQQEGLR
jgi:DNA topoisomerase IB